MKHSTSLLCAAALSTLLCLKVTGNMPSEKIPPKPKVVIFYSKGGYGHLAACATLKNTLKEYDVKVVNPFEEIVPSVDWVKKITWGRWDGETLYNTLLQNGWIRTMNLMFNRPARFFVHNNRRRIEQKMTAFLNREKPDLLISTIQLLNHSACNAAHQCKIPYLLITLDADLTLWLPDMEKCSHNNFIVTIGTKTPRIASQLAKKNIPDRCIREVGIALRPDFFEQKNESEIRAAWSIPQGKPVALLLRGGSGSTKLVEYAQALLKADYPLHILVCIGRNDSLIPSLKRLKTNDRVSLGIVQFTTRMSDLMFISNVLITQPSPNVCNEAMHFGVPILVDNTSPALFWEQATMDLINMQGSGTIFKRMKQLPKLVKTYLPTKKESNHVVAAECSFDPAIQGIVQELLEK